MTVVLTPRAIRTDPVLRLSEEAAAAAAGVCRGTLRTYEAGRELVKTPAKRWLLDAFYADLATLLAASARRRRLVTEGRFPDVDEGVTPEQALGRLPIAA